MTPGLKLLNLPGDSVQYRKKKKVLQRSATRTKKKIDYAGAADLYQKRALRKILS